MAQSFTLLQQKFRQHPVPADTEAAAPLDDLLRDLAEILSPEIGIPEPAVKICYRQYHPVAVLGPVGDIVGDKRVNHFGGQLLRPHSFDFCLKLLGQIHLISS